MDSKNTKEDERREIKEEYTDAQGKRQTRTSQEDFQTLPTRHLDAVMNVPGFKEEAGVKELMTEAWEHYEKGTYDKALQAFEESMKKIPALEPYIFYYIRVCRNVLAVPLKKREKQYEKIKSLYLTILRILPRQLWFILPKLKNLYRCKWCGRYTKYIHPNVPTFGFAKHKNSCQHCGTMYPIPSFMWDSPDGRAYSYYRKSFALEDKQFYEEFLRDYRPQHLTKRETPK